MKRILIIAATDSSAGAGLYQDIKVADRLNFWTFPIITGMTLQTFDSLKLIKKIEDDFLNEQLDFALNNFNFDTIKIGAICGVSQIRIIREFLDKTDCEKIVIDPVFSPTKGNSFLEDSKIYEELVSEKVTITPNIPELKRILGLDKSAKIDKLLKSALSYSQNKNLNIYLTGGHSKNLSEMTEYFISKNGIQSFMKKRQTWSYSHGTGCALSTAFSIYNCSLSGIESAKMASNFVTEYFSNLQNI
jgi:hydroxymethylpyrimidine/phosphomethylpyrimidine kinase